MGADCLYPDSVFELIHPTDNRFAFIVEIDAGSERIRSPKEVESWERKIRLYDWYQDASPERFRVLIVATHDPARVPRLLQAAATLVGNPQRSLFYGISLPAYLACSDALRVPCFRDQRGRAVVLVAPRSSLSPASSPLPTRASATVQAPLSADIGAEDQRPVPMSSTGPLPRHQPTGSASPDWDHRRSARPAGPTPRPRHVEEWLFLEDSGYR